MDNLTQVFLLTGTIYFAINIVHSIKFLFYKPENKNSDLLPLLMAILPLILAKKNEVNNDN